MKTYADKFENKGDDLYIDGKKVIEAWESFSGWYWFATEKMEERKLPDGSVMADGSVVEDTIWYGLTQGMDEEWGDFSEAELNQMIKKNMAWKIPKANWSFSGRRN